MGRERFAAERVHLESGRLDPRAGGAAMRRGEAGATGGWRRYTS